MINNVSSKRMNKVTTHFTLASAILMIALGYQKSAHAVCNDCIAFPTEDAMSISEDMVSGSTTIATDMTEGFENTASAVTGANANQTQQVVAALEGLTQALVSEIRQIPVTQQEIERRRNASDPARQATHPCTYTDRSADTGKSMDSVDLVSTNLNTASSDYNELSSNISGSQVQDSEQVFFGNAHSLLKDRENLTNMGNTVIENSDEAGALDGEAIQDASLFTNLTLNPNPPGRESDPELPTQFEDNVEADLYNMRMTLPQAVQNQIVAYEGEALNVGDESWIAEQMYRSGMGGNPESVSYSDLLKSMATHRTNDPQWVTNLSAKDTSGAIKDLAYIQADQAYMDYELWKQERNTALLLSQFAASQLRLEQKLTEFMERQ